MIILSGKTDMLQITLGNTNRPRLMIQALVNTRPARHVMRNQAAQDLKSDAGEPEYVVEEDQGAVAAVADAAAAVVITEPADSAAVYGAPRRVSSRGSSGSTSRRR